MQGRNLFIRYSNDYARTNASVRKHMPHKKVWFKYCRKIKLVTIDCSRCFWRLLPARATADTQFNQCNQNHWHRLLHNKLLDINTLFTERQCDKKGREEFDRPTCFNQLSIICFNAFWFDLNLSFNFCEIHSLFSLMHACTYAHYFIGAPIDQWAMDSIQNANWVHVKGKWSMRRYSAYFNKTRALEHRHT